MRERWARSVAFLTGAVVVLLSAGFALIQNPPAVAAGEAGPSPVAASGADPALIARGKAVYEALDCARCHSIAGEGNPRSPLDYSAGELNATQLRAFIIADESVAEELAPRTRAAKQPYADEPAEDIDAIVVYLQNLGA